MNRPLGEILASQISEMPGIVHLVSCGTPELRAKGQTPQHNTSPRHNPNKPNRRNDIPPIEQDKRKDSKGSTELPNGDPLTTEGNGNQQRPAQAPTDEEKKSFASP